MLDFEEQEVLEENAERLAEHIAAGELDDALDLLCRMHPHLGLPRQIRRRIEIRHARPETQPITAPAAIPSLPMVRLRRNAP